MKTLPIFYDHSSMKSILTFWNPKDCKENGPQSILGIAKQHELSEIVFVSSNFSTFLEAWKGCKDAKIKLIFGIEIVICDDVNVRTAESRFNEHKIIVFAKNGEGYNDLLKIFSDYKTNADFKYYIQRYDLNRLRELWTRNLFLAIPFFDGFIARNAMGFAANIIPDLHFCGEDKIVFNERQTGHPHEQFISKALSEFLSTHNFPVQDTKTIYYRYRKDFKAYSVYRAIQNGESFSAPEIPYFCSPEFCAESWSEIK